MENTQKQFQQSIFDKAFVAAIKYLTSKESGLLHSPNIKDLCTEMGIKSQFYDIKSGNRSVPKKNIDAVISILTSKYRVRYEFLKTNEGSIVDDADHVDYERPSLSHEPPGQYGLNKSNRDEIHKKEIDYLHAIITEKDKMIELLKSMIPDREGQQKAKEE